MRYDVFISYSSLDQKVAEGICAYLEQQKIRCFVSYRDIPAGVPWAKAITEALESSRMMVVVFSSNFNCSEQVDREIEMASEDRKPILTFRITNDIFEGAKKYYLKNLNWIDAFPNPEQQFGNLVENVMKLLGMGYKNSFVECDLKEDSIKIADDAYDKKDYDTAFRYYQLIAKSGNVNVLYRLALCYNGGLGVTRNYSEAVRLYSNLAERGHAAAQCCLGNCYWGGNGVVRDFSMAVHWYRESAKLGYSSAQHNLGYCYEQGIGISQDYSEAAVWYRKSAEQGNITDQYILGNCYYLGRGIQQDYVSAINWFKKAARQGFELAQKKLTELREVW